MESTNRTRTEAVVLMLLPILLLLVFMFGADWARAFKTADKDSHTGGKTYTLCDAFTTTGVCDTVGDGSGVDVAAVVVGANSFTVDSTESTGTYACDIYAAPRQLAYDNPVSLASEGFKINDTSLSGSQEIISFSGPFYVIWSKCPTNTGIVNITMQANTEG